MRYSILNTSATTYQALWDVLKEEECIADIPLECISENWIYQKLDDAISLDDNQGHVSPLYDIIMNEMGRELAAEGVTVAPQLSFESAFYLYVGQAKIRFPYISYKISIDVK